MGKLCDEVSNAASFGSVTGTGTAACLNPGNQAPVRALLLALMGAGALDSLPAPLLRLEAHGGIAHANSAARNVLEFECKNADLCLLVVFPYLADPREDLFSPSRAPHQEQMIARGLDTNGRLLSILLQPVSAHGRGEALICLFMRHQSDG